MKLGPRVFTAHSAILSVPRFFGMLAIIAAVELAIMLALSAAFPNGSPLVRDLVDALLVGLLSAPLLWWLVVRPLRATKRHRAHEAYVTQRSRAQFSHGLCPDCIRNPSVVLSFIP